MSQYRRTNTAPVLPIAPSPIAVTGHKRKLVGNTTSVPTIPRRDTSPAQLTPVTAQPAKPAVVDKPCDYWSSLLAEWNIPILDTVGIETDETPDKKVEFLETTSERVEAYQSIELITAVRRRDMATLKRIAAEKRAQGQTMNACNRFGESILHLACRKGSQDVVELLVGDECNCSLLVRDDYGRTVLHDACWTVNPPWELLKLILKKAPVLWRVSDIRGHLAMQYIPKSAWPQWAAFLSKNKGLLQRIMIHSYHHIDIMQQQLPQGQTQPQHQQGQIAQQETGATQDSSTNDATAAPSQNLPQHRQPAATTQTIPQQNLPMPLPTPASRPVSAHNSEEQLQSAAANMQNGSMIPSTKPTAPATTVSASVPKALDAAQNLASTAVQAQEVLAKALAQANPAMLQAISKGPQGPLKQGLSTFTPATAATPQPAKVEQPTQQAAPAPGPATAALDEALRAQSENRSKSRSNLLLTNQPPRKEPSKAQPQEKPHDGHEANAPIPYAPSISMIAARLKGIQQKSNAATTAVAQEPQAAVKQDSSQQEIAVNPLPAVPNPLLGMMSQGESSAPVKAEGLQENPPPAQMVVPGQEQDPTSNSNSVSSVTMSACPSVAEENGSDTTPNNTTDSDSDRAVTSSPSNPESDNATGSKAAQATDSPMEMDVAAEAKADASTETPMEIETGTANVEESSDSTNKASAPATEKIIVG